MFNIYKVLNKLEATFRLNVDISTSFCVQITYRPAVYKCGVFDMFLLRGPRTELSQKLRNVPTASLPLKKQRRKQFTSLIRRDYNLCSGDVGMLCVM